MPSFYDFALVCQSLSQTQSRLQMAETVGTFLAALEVDEAEIAARFIVGRAVEQGEEKRLQMSGRAIWKIVAELTGTEEQGEEIFTAAEDFGEAVEMMLKFGAPIPSRRSRFASSTKNLPRLPLSKDATRATLSSNRCASCSRAHPLWKPSTSRKFSSARCVMG